MFISDSVADRSEEPICPLFIAEWGAAAGLAVRLDADDDEVLVVTDQHGSRRRPARRRYMPGSCAVRRLGWFYSDVARHGRDRSHVYLSEALDRDADVAAGGASHLPHAPVDEHARHAIVGLWAQAALGDRCRCYVLGVRPLAEFGVDDGRSQATDFTGSARRLRRPLLRRGGGLGCRWTLRRRRLLLSRIVGTAGRPNQKQDREEEHLSCAAAAHRNCSDASSLVRAWPPDWTATETTT